MGKHAAMDNLATNKVEQVKLLEVTRKTMFLRLISVVTVILLGYASYYKFYAARYISTDNSYVGAEIAEVTSLTEGIVEHIHVTDTQPVKAKQLLITLFDLDAKLIQKQAETGILSAKIKLQQAELDHKRRKFLARSQAISEEELNHYQNVYDLAKASLEQALIFKEQAALNYARTKIYAPIDGIVVKRQVQLGQKVIAGTKLLAIVPITDLFVNANFKETQLKNIKIGQAVILTSDKYGPKVKYHGKIQGFYGGTGAAFAIIPAQNATGNWIKVVQRLPVRITLNTNELVASPLAVGLSMYVTVDTSMEK